MTLRRRKAFDFYWVFAAERQEVFYKRIRGEPGPWTEDPTIANFRFCNVYRASDRTSQYLIREVIYNDQNGNAEDILLRILVFRLFNKIETWQYLKERFGDIKCQTFSVRDYATAFEPRVDSGEAVFGNAYIMCPHDAFGMGRKYLNYLALIEQMIKGDRITGAISRARALKDVHRLLRSYPLIGDFLAHQLSIDINYSELVDFSEDSIVVPGPGVKRGIARCFSGIEGREYEDVVAWVRENQEHHFTRLGLRFRSLWGRPLHCLDCQVIFNEMDKYCTIRELQSKKTSGTEREKLSRRVKGKRLFHPRRQQIHFFYPPKWEINQEVDVTLREHRTDL